MKIKTTLLISILFFTTYTFSQQIGSGFAPIITDFTVPLQSGVFNALTPVGSIPDKGSPSFGWQHLLIIRHPNQNNNHQLQIASSFNINDRLFFRKLAGGLEPNNPAWIELATRGTNTFLGNQNIDGSQYITGNLFIGKDTEVAMISGSTNSGAIQIKCHSGLGGSQNRYLRLGWKDGNSVFSPALSINDDLNVGIGTTTPDSKLTVNGNIHAKEVKIDLSIPAPDYVFASDYKLKTLQEVEEYINKNSHLPEMPSAHEIDKNGLMLAEMNMNLLKKIEEMTLYMIEQNKITQELSKKVKILEIALKKD